MKNKIKKKKIKIQIQLQDIKVVTAKELVTQIKEINLAKVLSVKYKTLQMEIRMMIKLIKIKKVKVIKK